MVGEPHFQVIKYNSAMRLSIFLYWTTKQTTLITNQKAITFYKQT